MKTLIRYRYHLLASLILGTVMLMGAKTRQNPITQAAHELPPVQSKLQLHHALELFPDQKNSLAMITSGDLDMREFILSLVRHSLPSDQMDQAFVISRAVIAEANHHHMDPLFLLAVIKTESHFNIAARGTHGEVGLMQVLPKTATWLALQAGLSHKFDLADPATNIRIGATYFASLRAHFKHRSHRYLAAYNMGSTNVRRLIASKLEPEIYPARVLNNYEEIYLALRTSGEVQRSLASVQ